MKLVVLQLFCLAPLLGIATPAAADEGVDFFEKRIRPLLSSKCYQCHSAANDKMKGGLALDHRDGVLKGGVSGPAIIPGSPTNSLLIRAVSHTDPKLQMPSEEEKLSDAEIADLKTWIAMNAPDPRDAPAGASAVAATIDWDKAREHWSFRPLEKPDVPASSHDNPIDAFLFATMQNAGVPIAAPADRATWIRRVSYSLTGLPPNVRDLNAFVDDPRSDEEARQAVIQQLLSSEHYGVHWARHWLDVVRFGETSGAPGQWPIAEAWKYRDYIVDAFDADKPYPEFIREQLAGDLLGSDSAAQHREQLIATGYLAIARRFENKAIMHHLMLEDVIDNLGQAFLGLSLACARCHDHKFDPIPTADYYALYGIFRSTRFPYPGKEHSKSPAGLTVIGDDPKSREIADLYAELAKLNDHNSESYHLGQRFRDEIEALQATRPRTAEQEARLAELTEIRTKAGSDRKAARSKTDAIRKKFPDDGGVDAIFAVSDCEPVNARIQRRGEVYNEADEVPRGFLQLLDHARLPTESEGSGRQELADWIASEQNPLTSRVIVNRVWHWHFSRGLVTTPNDFGTRGAEPTNQQLLDFLAVWFVENGWSFKKLHELILSSNAYALSAENDTAHGIDPENKLYARFPRRRLTAEEMRDSLLFVSGQMSQKLGGDHGSFVAPVARRGYSQGSPWRPKHPEIETKRSLYLFHHRSLPHPVLALFDGADATVSTAERGESNTALQGLFFLNSPFFHECADK
ncbi:MAG: PSD1 and planctomycete cytochrome C domain-containing protein, partial [Verrucomicrobiota bacterium]